MRIILVLIFGHFSLLVRECVKLVRAKINTFNVRLLQEIGIDFDKSWIVACHRLGKMDRIIVKFSNRKDTENVFSNKGN